MNFPDRRVFPEAPYYRVYGLTLQSDVALPGEARLESDGAVDATIRRGRVCEQGTEFGRQIGPYVRAKPGALWLDIPDVARFAVRDGREIVYEPIGDVGHQALRLFLLGSCLGALMIQRGHLVLHGNAIRIGDGVAICCGVSGAGKSTLAASMMQAGQQIVADDVCPLTEQGEIIPGLPRIKLWQDSAERLGIATDTLERVRPELKKFELPLGEAFCNQPLPVSAVYVLNTHVSSEFSAEVLTGIAAFEALKAHTYRFRYVDGLGKKIAHFKACGRLASRVPVVSIKRPRAGFEIDKLNALILGDLKQQRLSA